MSVFPCLLYNSAVRSSTSVHFLDIEVVLLLAHRCLEIVKRSEQTHSCSDRVYSVSDLDKAFEHPMRGHLVGLRDRSV